MKRGLAILGAVLWLAPALAADPRGDALYQSAVAKYGAADYQGAIRDAEAAVQIDPGNWQAWQVDGNARYALGDKAGAATVYRYALQGNPNNPQLKAFVESLAGSAQAAPAAAAAQVLPAQAAPAAPASSLAIAPGEERPRTADLGFLERLSIRLWGGYGMVGSSGYLKDQNDRMDKAAQEDKDRGATVTVTRISSVIQFGGEIGFDVTDDFMLGVCIGSLSSNEARYDYSSHDDSWAPVLIEDTKETDTGSFTAFLIMAGGRYAREVAPKIVVRGGLFAGLASAKGTSSYVTKRSYSGTWGWPDETSTLHETFDGSGFAAQVTAGAEYRFTPRLAAAVDAGYRLVKTTLFAGGEGDWDGDGVFEDVYPREVVKKKDNTTPAVLDLGGLIATISVAYHF